MSPAGGVQQGVTFTATARYTDNVSLKQIDILRYTDPNGGNTGAYTNLTSYTNLSGTDLTRSGSMSSSSDGC